MGDGMEQLPGHVISGCGEEPLLLYEICGLSLAHSSGTVGSDLRGSKCTRSVWPGEPPCENPTIGNDVGDAEEKSHGEGMSPRSPLVEMLRRRRRPV
jgi:hypothetical protein